MTTKVIDCDVAVLGAAASGLIAAVKTADLTGKKVIVLEKAKKPGGASIFAGNIVVADSTWQRELSGTVNSKTQNIKGQFFDWLVSKGGAEKYFVLNKNKEITSGKRAYGSIWFPQRLEKYKNLPDPSIGPGKMGSYIVDKMVECCEKTGIPIFTETRARKFITDKKGQITGVLADTKDGQVLVNCKASIIATGGFGSNYERLKKYWPEFYNNKEIHWLCPPGLMGDGIDMAEEIGAVIDQTKRDAPMGDGPLHHPYSFAVHSLMQDEMTVSINLDGKRWRSEKDIVSYKVRPVGSTSIEASLGDQRGGVVYALADEEIIETVGPKIAEAARTSGGEDSRVDILEKWREEIAYEAAIDEEGASGNHTKKANSLVELALKMKMDPKTFVETIERYNKFCETGKDLDFGKPAQFLKPIRKPPFYAFYGHRWSQCTKGRNGICVNPKFEVLNAKGEKIPGLYAVGDCCTIFGGSTQRAGTSGAAAGVRTAADASGTAGGGRPVAGVTGAASNGVTAGMGGASGVNAGAAVSVNILSTEGSPNGALDAAVASGYQAAINITDYLRNL